MGAATSSATAMNSEKSKSRLNICPTNSCPVDCCVIQAFAGTPRDEAYARLRKSYQRVKHADSSALKSAAVLVSRDELERPAPIAQCESNPYPNDPISSTRGVELLNLSKARLNSTSYECGLSSPPANMIPSWGRDPEPLRGWTDQEHRILIAELQNCPSPGQSPQQIQELLERLRAQLPARTLEEIESCLGLRAEHDSG